jgi:hypothetical protein
MTRYYATAAYAYVLTPRVESARFATGRLRVEWLGCDRPTLTRFARQQLQQRFAQRDLIEQLAAVVVETHRATTLVEAAAGRAILDELQHDRLEQLAIIDWSFVRLAAAYGFGCHVFTLLSTC